MAESATGGGARPQGEGEEGAGAGGAGPLDVLCVGEALVDFLPDAPGRRVRDVEAWRRCVGGSPANVAVAVARLGGAAGFAGVVGEDEFGHFLRGALAGEGVDVRALRQTSEGRTGLVFISLTAGGERSFAFHRTRSAELFLRPSDVPRTLVARARAVHLGTNSLLLPEARAASLGAAREARAAGRLVTCDPNLRLGMWGEPGELRALLGRLLPLCSVVKVAEDELEFVTGRTDARGALDVLSGWGVALPVVTLGERGALLRFKGADVAVPAPPARVVDTTGAGDGFTGALLFGLTRLFGGHAELLASDGAPLEALATFACAVGARVVERHGAVDGLPRLAEVADLLPAALRPAAP
jgi:fructokinase